MLIHQAQQVEVTSADPKVGSFLATAIEDFDTANAEQLSWPLILDQATPVTIGTVTFQQGERLPTDRLNYTVTAVQ